MNMTGNNKKFTLSNSAYYASLFGACILAFGIGLVVAKFMNDKVGYVAILIGAALHGWGMMKVQKENS